MSKNRGAVDMGRAERRRQERQDRIFTKKGNISISPADLKKHERMIADKIARFDVELMQTCFALVLHDSYGADEDEIVDRLHDIDNLFGQILEGYITADDLVAELYEKTGLQVKFSGDE